MEKVLASGCGTGGYGGGRDHPGSAEDAHGRWLWAELQGPGW